MIIDHVLIVCTLIIVEGGRKDNLFMMTMDCVLSCLPDRWTMERGKCSLCSGFMTIDYDEVHGGRYEC